MRHVERVVRGVASEDEIGSVLGALIELLEMACDEQVVLLVDGYDAAWSGRASAMDNRGAGLVERLNRVLFDAIAAAGDSLRLACLMGECPGPAEAALSVRGCSYRLVTPLSTWCDRWFGFSDSEVQALLSHAGCEEYLDDAREWLEGYRFGGAYCSSPARVIGFLDRGCTPPMRVDLYGYADCLSEVVAGWNLDRLSALFDLLEAHGCVEVPLRLGAAEPDALPDDDLWTALYLSGFLTTDMTEEPVSGDRRRALRLPNNELRHALRLVIIEWFECAAEDVRDIDALRDGLCRGDEDAVRRALCHVIGRAGIGATDPDAPLPYHLLLQGLCFGLPGYANPASRRKCGADRWDIQVFPTGNVFDVADTIGMLDERPLITVNMMCDPVWMRLAWSCWRCTRCSRSSATASTRFECRDPAWAACVGVLALMDGTWQWCVSGCRGAMRLLLLVNRCQANEPYPCRSSTTSPGLTSSRSPSRSSYPTGAAAPGHPAAGLFEDDRAALLPLPTGTTPGPRSPVARSP